MRPLDDIERDANAATPRPWRNGRSVGRTLYSGDVLIGLLDQENDAVFAAVARTDVPDLIAALRERDATIERLRAALERVAAQSIDPDDYDPPFFGESGKAWVEGCVAGIEDGVDIARAALKDPA